MNFTKMSGAGNSFIFVNLFKRGQYDIKELFSQAQQYKTDGVVFLKEHPRYDFEWIFFNQDGSSAEMCGNAARCATLFYTNKINNKEKIQFLTIAGIIEGQVLKDGNVSVDLNSVEDLKKIDEKTFKINTGVPHLVIYGEKDLSLARRLRKEQNTNVTFIKEVAENLVEAVTFERGVEDYTLACGTGALAAAVAHEAKNPGQKIITVRMPGGDLQVSQFHEKKLRLTGPAVFIQDYNQGEK